MESFIIYQMEISLMLLNRNLQIMNSSVHIGTRLTVDLISVIFIDADSVL